MDGDFAFALTHRNKAMVKLLDRKVCESRRYRKVCNGNEEQHVGNDTRPTTAGLYFEQSVGFHFGDQPFVVAGTGTTSAKMEFNRSLCHLYHTCVKKSTLVNFL